MKQKVIELLKQAQSEGETFAEKLNAAERRTTGTQERWSAKDVLAHVAEWERHLVARCVDPRSQMADGAQQEDVDLINAEIFETYREKSWDEIGSVFLHAHLDAGSFIASMTEVEFCDTNRYPWMEGKPTWRWLLGTFYVHAFGHYEAYYLKHGEAAEARRLQETAAASLLPVSDADEWRALVTYNLACINAMAGEKEKAIAGLGEALRLNPGLREWSRLSPDLLSLHGDPGYEALY